MFFISLLIYNYTSLGHFPSYGLDEIDSLTKYIGPTNLKSGSQSTVSLENVPCFTLLNHRFPKILLEKSRQSALDKNLKIQGVFLPQFIMDFWQFIVSNYISLNQFLKLYFVKGLMPVNS